MAQVEGMRNIEKSTVDHLHGGGELHGHSTPTLTPSSSKSDDYDDDHGHHHEKKSVFIKVKAKAKKWKHMLQKKRHSHDGTGVNATPAWRRNLDEDDDEEKDPEFHGAPMYESEMAPDIYRDATSKDFSPRKETAGFQSVTNPSIAVKHMLEDKCRVSHEGPAATSGNNKSLTGTVSDILAPAYTKVSEATTMIASKIHAPILSARDEAVAKQMWDKGVSVKEYLLQKLEPGEDDKALSQVISEAISPKMNSSTDVSVVEKVKEVVSTLFRMEDSKMSSIPVSTMPHTSSVASNPQPAALPMKYSLSLSRRTSHKPVMESSISLPTSVRLCSYPTTVTQRTVLPTSHADEIEETGEKTLQEYLN